MAAVIGSPKNTQNGTDDDNDFFQSIVLGDVVDHDSSLVKNNKKAINYPKQSTRAIIGRMVDPPVH